ncbi:unnamed protein product [Cladocopium goreaui]|uniref:F5/8 type C domain-containing protein n=1 Tax=Cladocopium goreaui TaxID=2562237 RepID=A0A9P1BXM3_9DINO|nr:unnamed protein product [Cladocopium goreaui]
MLTKFAVLLFWVPAAAQKLTAFDAASASSIYSTKSFGADLATLESSGRSFTARRHLLGVNLRWSYAPAEVKVLTSLDGGNFEEAAGWRQIARSEPSFEETIMFAAPVAAKAVKVLMRGAKPWGYFGLSAAAGVSAPYSFMLVSGGPAVREQCVVSSGHGLTAEPCLDAIVAGDGRDVFTFTSEGSLQTASGYCVRLAGDKLELEKCDSSTGVWEASADGQVKQGNMCLAVDGSAVHALDCDEAAVVAVRSLGELLRGSLARQGKLLKELQALLPKLATCKAKISLASLPKVWQAKWEHFGVSQHELSSTAAASAEALAAFRKAGPAPAQRSLRFRSVWSHLCPGIKSALLGIVLACQNEKKLAAADVEHLSMLQQKMLRAEEPQIDEMVSQAFLGKKAEMIACKEARFDGKRRLGAVLGMEDADLCGQPDSLVRFEEWDGEIRGSALKVQQLLEHEADKVAMFLCASLGTGRLCQAQGALWPGSLKMDGNEVPLDKHVTRLSIAPRVTMLLLPLPANQKVVEVPDKPRPAPKAAPVRPAPKGSTKHKTRAERSTSQPDQLDGLSGLDKIKVVKANMLYESVYVEAAYPVLLCERIVHRLRDKALQCGATAPETLFEQAEGPEKELRRKMPQHVLKLVGNKRLILWKEILSLAKALNASTFRNMDVRQDPELEAATWEETEEEAKKGWIWFDDSAYDSNQKFIGRSPVDGAIRLIGFDALPFGAVGSVAGFLRVSLAVWFIGVVALQLCWTVFYDVADTSSGYSLHLPELHELTISHRWLGAVMDELPGLRYIGMDPLNGVIGLSLMPTPGNDGQALQRSLESDEASRPLVALEGFEFVQNKRTKTLHLVDHRYAKVKTTIQGFLIQGETEPSHALVDKCQVMFDTNSVVWLAPSVCTKRELEIQAAPKDNQQVLKIESQTLKVSTEGVELEDADHSSEIKLQWCWQRRGVALEMCEILSWQTSQKWLSTMFAVYASEPPANFSRVTLTQLISADKALWTILARETESVKPDATGSRPLDAAVEKLMCDPRVTMHMLSMPHKAPAALASTAPDKPSSGAQTSHAAQTGVRLKKKARPGKRNRATATPPEELKSCYQTTSDGKPICCAYNLGNGIAIQDPQAETPRLFGPNTLPLVVATNSVASFLRVSAASFFIFTTDIKIWCRVDSTGEKCLHSWRYVVAYIDNEASRQALIKVNLESCKDRTVSIGHTEERRAELVAKVKDILAEGWLGAKEAERLRGRVSFFESYAFGRLANAAIKNIGRFCVETSGKKRLDASIQGSLLLLGDRVLELRGRDGLSVEFRFFAPVAAKAVKILMRGAKPWGYFGLSAAAGVSAPYSFMLVSGGPGSSRAVRGVFWPRP